MMRICFLNKDLNIKAGVGRYGRDIVENISKKKGIEAIVLTEQGSGHKLEKVVLRKSYLLQHFYNIFINALRIRKYIKGCDIIHALDGYPYGVIAALANVGINKKLIINGIGTYSVLPLDEPIKRILMKWAYKKANKVICISNFTKQQILKRIKLDNTVVINLGVNYEKFSRSRYTQIISEQSSEHADTRGNLQRKSAYSSEARSDQRVSARPKVVLSVGALKPRKGYHVSIPAIAEVKKKYPDIKYYIVGGPPPRIYLDLVEKYNLKKNVKFFQDLSDKDLIKLYYQSNVFLLTPITINNNDFEGFGLVYLEAGACGKPAIGTYDCGAEDAIVDNQTGFLVPQNDVQKTAEAILKLLDNPELAKKLGENNKKRAQQMSWDRIVKKYINVYNQLL